jgi:monothiol glutaredoxin
MEQGLKRSAAGGPESSERPRTRSEVNEVDVTERIQQQLKSNRIVLFMKGTPDFPQCGFSAAVSRALAACGAEFASVNVFEDPELREALKRYSNWPTYPQLYVDGELIGGADIIQEMHRSGELQQLVRAAG